MIVTLSELAGGGSEAMLMKWFAENGDLVKKDEPLYMIEYRKIAESGPDHNKTFTIEVEINGKTAGRGTGQSKAKAEQAAAEDALSKGV